MDKVEVQRHNSLRVSLERAVDRLTRNGKLQREKGEAVLDQLDDSLLAGLSKAVQEPGWLAGGQSAAKDQPCSLNGTVHSFQLVLDQAKFQVEQARLHVSGYGTVHAEQLFLVARAALKDGS